MSFIQENIVTVPIDSSKGIDGSMAITRIPQGNCYGLENADISTAGVITRRKGYQEWAGDFPVHLQTTNPNSFVNLDAEFLCTISLIFVKYNDANVSNYIDPIAVATVRNLSEHIIVRWTTTDPNFVGYTPDENTMIGFGSYAPIANAALGLRILPCGLFDQVMVISFGDYESIRAGYPAMPAATALGSYTLTDTYGNICLCRGPHFLQITESEILTAVRTGTSLAVTTAAPVDIHVGSFVYWSLYGSHGTCTVANATRTAFTLVFTQIPVWAAAQPALNYFNLSYLPSSTQYLLMSSAYVPNNSTSTDYTTRLYASSAAFGYMAHAAGLSSGYGGRPSQYLYGSGVNVGSITAIESVTAVGGEEKILWGACSGAAFTQRLSDSIARSIKSPGVVGASGTYAKDINGNFVVSAPTSSASYLPGDIVYHTQAVDTKGTITTKSFTILTIVAPLVTLVPDDTTYATLTLNANEILQYTRTSKTIYLTTVNQDPAYPVIFPTYHGSMIQLSSSYNPSLPCYRVNHSINTAYFIETITLELEEAVTYNSYDEVLAIGPWLPTKMVSLGASNDIYRNTAWLQNELAPLETSPLASLSFSSSVISTSKDSGMFRFDGSRECSLLMFQPQILSARSVPGSKGLLGVRQDATQGKLGLEVRLVLTFSYIDDYGRTIESVPTGVDDLRITPNACIDGTNYAELIEFSVAPPPRDESIPLDKMWLNVYRTVVEQTTDTELQFVLEKRVPVGVSGRPISEIVGDKGLSDAASRITLDALITGSNVPAPRAKVISTLQNRMFAMNIATLPFVRIGGTRVFGDDGLFNSRLVVTAYKNYIAKVYDLYNPQFVRYITYPWGVSSILNGNVPTFTVDNGSMPIPYNQASTIALDVHNNGNTGINAFTLTYQDQSNIFTATNTAALTNTDVKFRCLTKGYQETYSIRFLTDVFKITNSQVTAPTKWLNNSSDLSTFKWVLFENIGTFDKSSQVTISISDSTDNNAIYLYVLKSHISLTPTILDSKYIVVQGAGTIGAVKEYGSSTELSWDKDLTFLTTNAVDATLVSGGAVYSKYTLTPVRLSLNSSGVIVRDTFNAAATLQYAEATPNITIFGFDSTTPATVASRLVNSGFTGFTNPSDIVQVSRASGISAGLFAAGDYVTFSFSTTDFNLIGKTLPPLKGSYKVLTTTPGTPGSFTIQVQPSYEVYSALTGTSVAVSTASYAINTKKIFFNENGPGVVGRIKIALKNSGPVSLGTTAFLVIRGMDPAGTSLQYSGWYNLIDTWTNGSYGGVIVEQLSPFVLDIDYSKISAIDFSALLYCNNTVYANVGIVAIPVPLSSEVSPNLKDLARPVFTQDFISPESMLIQVTKRLAMAVAFQRGFFSSTSIPHFGYGLFGDVTSLNIPSEENSAILVETIPTTGNRNICPSAPETLYTLDVEKSGVYTAYGFRDNFDGSQTARTSDLTSTAQSTVYPAVLDLPNFIQWSSTVAENVEDAAIFPMFKRGFTVDLGSQDDAEITAACPFRDMLLVFKRNSVWRIGVDDKGKISAQRLQATVGTLGMKNVVAYDDGVYFLHESGMHVTDGNAVLSVFALSRSFEKFVTRSPSLLARCAGYADTEAKFAVIGIPYNSEFSSPVDAVDGQFAFSYNDNVLGWSVNTHIDAVAFARVDNQTYFGSTRGRVYRFRTEEGLTKYRDGSDPIPFMLQTRYLPALGQQSSPGVETSDQVAKFKFLRNVVVQFGADTDYDMQAYYSLDYKQTRVPMELYQLRGGTTINGVKILGNDRFVKALRNTLGIRAAQISFTLFDNSLDSDSAIYSISVEGWVTNTRLVPQQATRSGAR